MLSVEQKIEHLKKLGFVGDFTEVRKFYAGQEFNQSDSNIEKLIRFSEELWNEYSFILKELPCVKSAEKVKLLARKEELVSIAFPNHGVFVDIRDGFYCTVCAIDFEKNSLSCLNKNVRFGKYTLAELGDFALLGEDVRIGAILGTDVQPNAKVILGNDIWLCASTVIGAGAIINPGTVVGLGACVYPNQITETNTLVIGNPAKVKSKIDDHYQSKKDNLTYRSADEIDFIVRHLRNLGLDVDEAYLNALKGEKYNCALPGMARITEFSHQLSYEYNHPQTSAGRRREILKILFPICGKNFQVGRGLFVDVLGLARIGDDVHIGDNAFFAGNITIGNNVEIGANLILAGIGHEMPATGRRFHMLQDVVGEPCEVGKIQIADNVKIGKYCTMAPGSILTQNLSDYTYVVGNNRIFKKVKPEQFGNDFTPTH